METPHFTIAKIKWLKLFKNTIAVYSEKYTKYKYKYKIKLLLVKAACIHGYR
jgi:hypothetical protein